MGNAAPELRAHGLEVLVGVKLIDDQHREVIRRVRALLDALDKGEEKAEVGRILSSVAASVLEHFATEEQLMAQHHYPDAAAHGRQHAAFVKKFEDIRAEVDRTGATPENVAAVDKAVCGWLRGHLAGPDTALGKYLTSSGDRIAT